jgi:hypothetical protein
MQTTIQSPEKAHLSIKVDVGIKSDLQKIAQSKNRSVHYLLIEAVERYIAEQKADEEYNEWVKQRVLQAQKNLHENGSSGISSQEAHKIAMEKVKAFLMSSK